MSDSESARLQIGCPECESTVHAAVPRGPGLDAQPAGEPTSIRGVERSCRNCGHELEFYYY